MKKWILLAVAIGILVGVGAILLSTRQAPLITETNEPAAQTAPSVATNTITDTAATTATETAADASVAKKILSAEEFRALLLSVRAALPRKEALQKLDESEIHGTPEPIVEAGRQLGRVAQALADDPSHAREAFGFYESCAGTHDFADSVRALCFFHYRAVGGSLGLEVRESIAPQDIRDLADRLQGS